MRSVLVCVCSPQTLRRYGYLPHTSSALRTAWSGDEALAWLAKRPADVVVAETAATGPDCVRFTRVLRARYPRTVLVLVGAEDPRLAGAAVAAGAHGVIAAGQQSDELVSALVRGLLTASPDSQPTPAHRPSIVLSERERQVLDAMSRGCSNAEIGRQLFLSEDTIKSHARRLFRKLGVRDRAHAVAAAFRAGLIT